MAMNGDPSGSQWLGQLKGFARGFLSWLNEEGGEAEHPPSAAGTMLMTNDGRALFMRRARGKDSAGTWAFPGGMSEDDELPWQTAMRETQEEVGDCGMEPRGLRVIDHSYDPDKLGFTTFGYKVEDEFDPELNDEHDAYMWAPLGNAPRPLHPGVEKTIQDFAMDPLTDKGEKILKSMQEQYGPEKGKQVFYASKNAGKISGVDAELATDPPTSEAQRRAMHAAAEGRSNLGISRKVGKEFADEDKGGELPERKGEDDRYQLVPDENRILDRHTGQTYGIDDAMRILFSKDAASVATPKVEEPMTEKPSAAWKTPMFKAGAVRRDGQDAGTSEGARKAAATRKAHGGGSQAAGRQYWENKASGQKNNPYPHSVSTHQALRNKHSDTGARFAHMPGHQQIYTQGSRLHAAAAKALAVRAPNARELSEKAHAYTNKVGQRYGFRE